MVLQLHQETLHLVLIRLLVYIQSPPHSSPAPGVYYGFGLGNGPLSSLAPSTLAPTPSSLAVDPFYRKIWLLVGVYRYSNFFPSTMVKAMKVAGLASHF
ncbi:hypothetical protein OIU77_023906 [Salix suchowensis]|uniref:Uncharacterized protein n=1 Tax=Salix suchowensis TaxID=1278906 RepID=A0ABQ9C7A6_9ROSI|nr:hypothetical protein OIU77_023906 [Salix suchowensis]